jgi:cytochrome P450
MAATKVVSAKGEFAAMSLSEVQIAPVQDTPVLAAPTPPKKPMSMWEMLKAPDEGMLAAIPAAAYEEPIYELKSLIGGNFFIVSDPAGVKRVLLDNVANYPKGAQESEILAAAFGDGLLTSDGDKWRSHRRTMAPSFDHRSIVAYAPAMVDTSHRFAGRWSQLGAGAEVDMQAEMTALALAIITRTMFSADSDGIQTLMGDTLRDGMGAMKFSLLDMLPLLGPKLMARKMDNIHAIFSALDASIYELIGARGGEADGPTDLLARLVAARDAESGARMTNQEVRDEVVITFFAGHETTAIAMTFIWYLLAKHPLVEARLHQELATVLGGREPAYEDLENLPYTRQVIQEAMRLYPPAPGLSGRQAVADDKICGRRIPKGAQVGVLPWVLHRHKTLWDQPDRFDPDRFSPENSVGRDRLAYLPFGGGPRICIGMAMAMTEAMLILATLAQRFQPRLVETHEVTLKARVTLRARDGVRMTLEPRGPN